MNLILKATQFSALKHQNQKRKDGKTPYVIHPISVAMILSEIGGIDDEEILSAALFPTSPTPVVFNKIFFSITPNWESMFNIKGFI